MMWSLRAHLSVLVLSYVVLSYAQDTAICNGPNITISSTADAQSIAACTTYNGDVIISSSATGTIELHGIEQISGDLRCRDAAGLNGITSDTLTVIGGSFNLQKLQTLNVLSFATLKSVVHIHWVDLPSLGGLDLAVDMENSNDITIVRTILKSLDSINIDQVGSINVTENPWLDNINFDALENISKSAVFAANGHNLAVKLPSLKTAGNLTICNAWNMIVPALMQVFGSFVYASGYGLNVSVPNLTTVGSTLTLSNSKLLNALSFPALTTIGGSLEITNNTGLGTIDGFDQLQAVAGNVSLVGTFDRINCPKLRDVRGAANVETSSQNQTLCNYVQSLSTAQIVKQKASCAVNMAMPEITASTVSPTSPRSSSAPVSILGLSVPAFIGTIVASGIAGLSLIGIAIWLCCARFRSSRIKKDRELRLALERSLSDMVYEKPKTYSIPPVLPVPSPDKDRRLRSLPRIDTSVTNSPSTVSLQSTKQSTVKNYVMTFTPGLSDSNKFDTAIISPERPGWDRYFSTFRSSWKRGTYQTSRRGTTRPDKRYTTESQASILPEFQTPPRPTYPSPPRVRSTIFDRAESTYSSNKDGKSRSDY